MSDDLLKAWANKLYMAIHAVVSKYNREMDELDIAAPDSDLVELVKYTIFRHLRWHGEERKDALTARIAELEGAHEAMRSLYQEHGTIALHYCGDDPPEEAWSVHTMLLLSPSLHLEAPGRILGSGPTPEAAIKAALAGKDAE